MASLYYNIISVHSYFSLKCLHFCFVHQHASGCCYCMAFVRTENVPLRCSVFSLVICRSFYVIYLSLLSVSFQERVELCLFHCILLYRPVKCLCFLFVLRNFLYISLNFNISFCVCVPWCSVTFCFCVCLATYFRGNFIDTNELYCNMAKGALLLSTRFCSVTLKCALKVTQGHWKCYWCLLGCDFLLVLSSNYCSIKK